MPAKRNINVEATDSAASKKTETAAAKTKRLNEQYVSAAVAVQAMLSSGATFTRSFYMQQPNMTACYWRFAVKLGLKRYDYEPREGDVVGDKGGDFLLVAVQTTERGKPHRTKTKEDEGVPYALTPFGRYLYGKQYKAALKVQARNEALDNNTTETPAEAPKSRRRNIEVEEPTEPEQIVPDLSEQEGDLVTA